MKYLLVLALVILFFGTFPSVPWARNWGYAPVGGIGTILLIVVILLLLHVI